MKCCRETLQDVVPSNIPNILIDKLVTVLVMFRGFPHLQDRLTSPIVNIPECIEDSLRNQQLPIGTGGHDATQAFHLRGLTLAARLICTREPQATITYPRIRAALYSHMVYNLTNSHTDSERLCITYVEFQIYNISGHMHATCACTY